MTAHLQHLRQDFFISPGTIAERWGCSERTIRRMIHSGELPALRVGGKRLLRVRGADVLAAEDRIVSAADVDAERETA